MWVNVSKRKQMWVNASERKQMQANASKCKWMQVNVSECEQMWVNASRCKTNASKMWVFVSIPSHYFSLATFAHALATVKLLVISRQN